MSQPRTSLESRLENWIGMLTKSYCGEWEGGGGIFLPAGLSQDLPVILQYALKGIKSEQQGK